MRSFIRLILWLLGILVVAVAGLAVAVVVISSRRLHRHLAAEVVAIAPAADAAAIATGRHLATIRGCTSCHGSDLGGAVVMDDAAMGRIDGPNLTAGQGGIGGSLSNSDWVRAIRRGIGRDGHPLVIMPSTDFVELSDADVADIVGYIKSLPPVDRAEPPVALGPVSRALIAFGQMPFPADLIHVQAEPVPSVPVGSTPEYGRYLATTCSGCHNPRFSGGKISFGPPDWPPAANLTQGAGSAVKGWSEADFVRTIRTLRDPSGRALNPVMPAVFGQMSDVELKALWAYIVTLPPTASGS